MKVLLIGHSHVVRLGAAVQRLCERKGPEHRASVISLRDPEFRLAKREGGDQAAEGPKHLAGIDQQALHAAIARHADFDATVLCLNGNEHTVLGLFWGVANKLERRRASLESSVALNLGEWLGFLVARVPGRVVMVPPPPPIESEEQLRQRAKRLAPDAVVEAPEVRLGFWKLQCETIEEEARHHRISVLEQPQTIFSPTGFLAEDCIGRDISHGNDACANRVARALWQQLARQSGMAAVVEPPPRPERSASPYTGRPAHAFWKQAVGTLPAEAIQPVIGSGFPLQRSQRIATAGSCFAQHVSAELRRAGFALMQMEPATSDPAEADLDYGFSARYGNVYTSRQLLQLFLRAFGRFHPQERAWSRPDGRFCDPFRPRLRPQGFATAEEVEAAAALHLDCVQRMFRELEVFIFTLGLTECWESRADGAAYPLAPGVAGGHYDPAQHALRNLRVDEVVADLREFLAKLQEVNPAARVILTVSPVPLVATATVEHVLVANARSKAVLRAAADEVVAAHPASSYFPSYEIVTGAGYFGPDRREVTSEGVRQVMRVFMRHVTEGGEPLLSSPEFAAADALIEAECDEESLRS